MQTSPQCAPEWGYGGSLLGLSPRALRPADRKGRGTAWGEGLRLSACALGMSHTLGEGYRCKGEEDERDMDKRERKIFFKVMNWREKLLAELLRGYFTVEKMQLTYTDTLKTHKLDRYPLPFFASLPLSASVFCFFLPTFFPCTKLWMYSKTLMCQLRGQWCHTTSSSLHF